MGPALEALIWERACRRCEYCRMPREFDDLPFQIDHIIAEKHGGPTGWWIADDTYRRLAGGRMRTPFQEDELLWVGVR